MNCDRVHELLDRHLAGGLTAEERTEFDAHVSGCGECRSVVAAVAADDAPSIVQPVVSRTTGKICARVQEEMADEAPWTDAIRAHVAECATCERFAAVLVRCDAVLPDLAGRAPDADFASDVVMSTVDRPSLVHVAWRRAADRMERWLESPRVAREFAGAVTLFLLLLTSTPVSPFPDLPQRLLDAVRAPRGVIDTATVFDEGSLGDRVLDLTGDRGRRIVRDLDRVGQGIATTGTGFLLGDPVRVHRGADAVGCGLQSLWLGVRAPEEEIDGPCADPGAVLGTDGTTTAARRPAGGGKA